MTAHPGELIREYLDRVVNRHDLGGVDDLVAPEYRGSGDGWPRDIESLRQFYRSQQRSRPDWHIDVQETMTVGSWVAVRAHAGGTASHDDDGVPLPSPTRISIEWLSLYEVGSSTSPRCTSHR